MCASGVPGDGLTRYMCDDPSPHTSRLVVARTFQAAAVLPRHQHKGTALYEQVTVHPLCCDGHMAGPQAGPQERDPVSTPAKAFRERKRAFLRVNPGVKGSSSRSVPGAAHATGEAGRVPVPPSCEAPHWVLVFRWKYRGSIPATAESGL